MDESVTIDEESFVCLYLKRGTHLTDRIMINTMEKQKSYASDSRVRPHVSRAIWPQPSQTTFQVLILALITPDERNLASRARVLGLPIH